MPLAVDTLSAQINSDPRSNTDALANFSTSNHVNMEPEEEDEEEDVDFNPFIREETPSEASSSLSSDNEGTGENVRKGFTISADHQDASASTQPAQEIQRYNKNSGSEDEEVVMQTKTSLEEAYIDVARGWPIKAPSGDASDGAVEFVVEESSGQVCNRKDLQKQIIVGDNEDAISQRTRARHSLVHYTLEELEAFLQESDDDGDFQNVDDEEEYRKFLAAVLLDGGDNGQEELGGEPVDEDEDNDADFELEIEEALESDVDEFTYNGREWNKLVKGDSHRPETRQKKRLKESANDKKNLLGLAKTPLRPILPYISEAQVASFPLYGWQFPPKDSTQCPLTFPEVDIVNGFTAHQIGQLYSLIHEHAQLLIQIFSVCVLDPSRQHVASDVQKMIMEIVNRREEALALKKAPYPGCCFHPHHLHSSWKLDINQTSKSSYWTPLIDTPVLSILDVAPLRLAKSYLTDVSAAVLKYRQLHVEGVPNKSHYAKEPLFPLPIFASSSEIQEEVSEDHVLTSSSTRFPHSPGLQQPKKSLAAMLVESTKSRSVALVPKDIAKLAQRFYPLFNSTLFPHKPPVPAVANRVLFTDAEDRLLAMGMMEYNNDWAAIQQHYLPCKSKHQIFVRQKNRSSSKAPENPIKTVRRMKTSPLTPDELARISKGLKVLKHDWYSVWKFLVPHRDPALLQRQWRVATGTQKSYKKCEAFKMKRRLYEAKKRQLKVSVGDSQPFQGKKANDGGENNADAVDGEEEAYVHEAFLAETQPGSSNHLPSEIGDCNGLQRDSGAASECLAPSKSVHHTSHSSVVRYGMPQAVASKQLTEKSLPRPYMQKGSSMLCQTHKSRGVRLVKLAPDLPPVNLPPSGRVISQSAFRNYYHGSAYSKIQDNRTTKAVSCFSQLGKVGCTMLYPDEHRKIPSVGGPQIGRRPDGSLLEDEHVTEENTSESDVQMHPLLFQAPENESSSYYLVNHNHNASNTFNLFPVNSLQSDTDILKHQHLLGSVHTTPSSLSTINFHPLLQRTEANHDSAVTMSGDQDSLQGQHDQVSTHCIFRETVVDDGQFVKSAKSPSRHEKVGEVDLDIRLCSAKDTQTTNRSRCSTSEKTRESNIPIVDYRMAENGPHNDLPSHSQRENNSAIPVSTIPALPSNCSMNNVDPSKIAPLSNAKAYQFIEGNLQEDSIPGIIMEQEELSDSDEESEHVEFEREEMEDSEQDGLDNEQTSPIPNKEFPTVAAAQDVPTIRDLNLPPHQTACLTRGSVEESNKQITNGPCPSSSPTGSSPMLKPKRQRINKERAGKVFNSRIITRTTKKRNAADSNLQHLGAQQASGELRTTSSRKPRKRSLPK